MNVIINVTGVITWITVLVRSVIIRRDRTSLLCVATIVVVWYGIIILLKHAQMMDGVALIGTLRLAKILELAAMLHALEVDAVSPLRALAVLMVIVPKSTMIIAVEVY